MKRRTLISLITILSAFHCHALQNLDETLQKVSLDIASKCENKEIIAILDFSSLTEELSTYLNSTLTAMIFENTPLQVVSKQNMNKAEKELDFKNKTTINDSTALSIGKLLGANQIVFGSLEELDNKYTLRVTMLNISNGTYSLYKNYEIKRSSKTEQLLGRSANYCKSSVAVILEANKNSLSNIAPALGFYFDYSFFRRLSLGAKFTASYDALEKENSVYSVEPLGFMKFYLVSPSGEPSTGLFIQGDLGADIIFSNGNIRPDFEFGGEIGFKKEFDSFFIEPTIRFGSPYLFGAGIIAGLRF